MGSCFADNIGKMMRERCFPVTVNPFGTVYNPVAIVQSLQRLQEMRAFTDDEIIQSGDLYTTFFHHSQFSHPDKNIFLQQANEQLIKGAEALKSASYIMITLGTAWVYTHKETGREVNNCHKIPAVEFERSMLSVEKIAALFEPLIAGSHAQWIFTVSPIRHWKDGAHGNQLSKAALLLAVEQLQQQNKNVHYFPAYEIMMDELRDYRFYASDMLHPSAQAVEYIWERFSDVAFSSGTKKIMLEVEKIVAAKNHRLLHPNTESSQRFIQQLGQQIKDFTGRYPFIKFG